MSKLSNRKGNKKPCEGKTGTALKVCIEQYEYRQSLKEKDSTFNQRYLDIKKQYDEAKKLPDTTNTRRGEYVEPNKS